MINDPLCLCARGGSQVLRMGSCGVGSHIAVEKEISGPHSPPRKCMHPIKALPGPAQMQIGMNRLIGVCSRPYPQMCWPNMPLSAPKKQSGGRGRGV